MKEKKKRNEGKEERRKRDSLDPGGVVFLILKRTSYRFEGVDPIGTKFVCFSHFLLLLSLPLMFAALF